MIPSFTLSESRNMRPQAPPRREFILVLFASLALVLALVLLLTIRPEPLSFDVQGQDSRETLLKGGQARAQGEGEHAIVHNGRDAFQEAVLDAVGPLLRILQTPVHAYHSIHSRLSGWQHFEQENRRLKLEVDRLQSLSVRVDELSLENQRLRLLLSMRADPSYHELVAQIIGDSSSAFARSFLLNAGREEGVVYEATAMAPGGLLGRVVRVARHTSLVLTLPDLNSRVPVLVQRSRVRAILSGSNTPLLNMDFVPKGADVRVGDRLITSGIGKVFPKGLLVGQVYAIAATEETGLFHQISVYPAVDFDRVEEVRLLLPTEKNTAPKEPTTPNTEPGVGQNGT